MLKKLILIVATIMFGSYAFAQTGVGWQKIHNKQNFLEDTYFTKPLKFPSDVTLSYTDIINLKDMIQDTALLTDFSYLKSQTYSNGQVDSIGVLKANVANPQFTGKLQLTPTFTGTYIFGNGGASLVNTAGSNAFYNMLFGSGAGYSMTTGSWNVSFGTDALHTTTNGTYNTALGFSSMKYSTDAVANTAVGDRSLVLNTTGDYNSALGSMQLYGNTTGNDNTAIGYQAGFTNQTGNRNVFLGRNAGYYETGSDKLFIDNTNRTSEALARTSALVYGIFSGTTSSQQFTINGNLNVRHATVNISDTLTVASDARITNVSTTVLILGGRGQAVDISLNPQILDGVDCQYIELWGNSDTYTLKIDDGDGIQTNGGASRTLGLGDVLKLRYFASADVWREISFSDN